MSAVIDDLVRKLKTAERRARKAQQEYDNAQAQARDLLKALQSSKNNVEELQRAISLLRNGLKTPVVETGNVTQLKR